MSRYIDADKINAQLMDEYYGMISDESMKIYKIMRMLNNAPTADVQKVRYGEWIESDYGICHCSECGFEYKSKAEVTQYCPVCGANMGGGESDES